MVCEEEEGIQISIHIVRVSNEFFPGDFFSYYIDTTHNMHLMVSSDEFVTCSSLIIEISIFVLESSNLSL